MNTKLFLGLVTFSLLTPCRASLACTWLVPNDVFRMADRAARVSVVVPTTPSTGRVVRDLKGAGPMPITVDRNGCEPRFSNLGSRYLVFHRGDGESISDSSGAELVDETGERLVTAVETYLALPTSARPAYVSVLLFSNLARSPEVESYRLISDAVAHVGKPPPSLTEVYENYMRRVADARHAAVFATPPD